MRQMPSLLRRIAVTCVLAAAFCLPLAAATVSKLNDDVLAPLRGPVVAKRILLNNVPLYEHGTAKIDLEEFDVWAPGGKVIVNDGKSVQYLDPPPMRFFRGSVSGDPESFAYFSVDETTGAIQGLVATRDGKFSVNAARRHLTPRDRSPDNLRGDDFDYFLTASDESDEMPMTGKTWECGVESLPALPHVNKRILTEVDASGHPIIAQGITGTQSFAITVEVETDDELFAAAGNSVSAVTALATNLTGAVSTIYNRDLHTNVVQQNVHVYSGGPGTDPWMATDAFNGLAELGNNYHTNHLALKRSAVVMLSGKTTQSGVAWEGTIGEGDSAASINSVSTFSGAYAWCGSIGDLQGSFTSTVPDPNATTNGTQFGMPTGGNNYWPLEEYAHELGHNLAGHHTHCVVITAGEAAGTNHPSQLFIDMCHTGEVEQSPPNSACATGTDFSSAPTEKGTIMSYCHNVFSGGVPQSRFTFGQASEVSHHELDDYMLNASGPLAPNGGSFNIVTAVGTLTMSTITASSTVAPNSTGNTASVTTMNGGTPTFSWTITGGTITSATNTTSITYTAGASGNVVLRATAFKNGTNGSSFPDGGVGITDTKTVTIVTCVAPAISTQPQSVAVPAGTGVTLSVGATGTSLAFQWFIGTSGVTTTPIGGGTAASVNVTPSSTTTYWVRVSNSCGSVDSASATVTVQAVAAANFFLLAPCRVLDTRGGAPVPANGVMNLVLTGKCSVAAGATAAVVNVTVVSPAVGGLVTLYPGPANTVKPVVSTINYTAGRTLANNARITIGVDGSINIFNAAGTPLDFLIDVSGYFK
ncbi:MAG TPA: M12 family metallo-peptidase [Thermoanaerobaculia bacterium]|jgi:hypothetical protein|nr:M12 family metallo-peptidase [Thermoanaerobaculia bacterium]